MGGSTGTRTELSQKTTDPPLKPRYLILHGKRTSGDILTMQTAAFRANVGIAHFAIDAPIPASGEPDAGIKAFYPDREYFEWCVLIVMEAIIASTPITV